MKRTRRLLIFPPLAIAGAAAVLILSVATALACHNTVAGTTDCQDGAQLVSWTVTNDAPFFTEHATWATTAGGSGSFTLTGGAATTLTETLPATQTGTETMTVTATWKTRKGFHTATASGTVTLTGDCSTPPPPPRDLCKNLPGIQQTVPAGYLRAGVNCYKVAPSPRDKKPHHHRQSKRQRLEAFKAAAPKVTVTVQQIADSGSGGG